MESEEESVIRSVMTSRGVEIDRLRKQLELAEISISALQAKLKRVTRVSKSRLARLRQANEAVATLIRETHGG